MEPRSLRSAEKTPVSLLKVNRLMLTGFILSCLAMSVSFCWGVNLNPMPKYNPNLAAKQINSSNFSKVFWERWSGRDNNGMNKLALLLILLGPTDPIELYGDRTGAFLTDPVSWGTLTEVNIALDIWMPEDGIL